MLLADHQQIDRRLTEEMARCHADYDEARQGLAEHHAKQQKRMPELKARVEKLRELVAPIFQAGEPLTPRRKKAALQYLEALAEMQECNDSMRLSYGATLRPGLSPPGEPLGCEPNDPTGESED